MIILIAAQTRLPTNGRRKVPGEGRDQQEFGSY